MMSLGRAHRLYLLNRIDRLKRRGVRWTAEEVAGCYTMEQFLDYLEARGDDEAEAAPCYCFEVGRRSAPGCRHDIDSGVYKLSAGVFYHRRWAARTTSRRRRSAGRPR